MRGYRFDFRCYRRRFLQPLVTNHGIWHTREGIIVCLGGCGYGEIAPISWFSSETLEQALDFCRQLPAEVTEEMIFSIPDNLPACQFGFESALGGMGSGEDKEYSQFLTYSALLPSGEGALSQWEKLWKQGYRTFKWKIGVDAIYNELKIFDLLTRSLPPAAKLRLDANGGLSYEEAKLWLGICDDISANIEFLEQPLPVSQFSAMLELSASFQTAIALDESVATLQQLENCFQQGWRGIFVIKPGIAGSPSRLRQFCQKHQIDAVFSSVFETEIGRQAALQLAAELSLTNRAVGFGINHFLAG
ncbi:o-succinylbenzoate synthase [Nodularia sphaerocarpa]|uniref:o-succinylbenzoate synthase n=1 Tax=Nodularia sphaerocarpa TaxID=137816 RepID=UPI001EFA763A|nr:o-succinylbenzoate synthase [Nodularia sphaerocarpa]MDB9374883.1 o-succinylbenzoate synthase [Nodularia sphaerocarpa CS-585]MDB9376670.1 o-succinylbenzoate synthase [Nodularia sphaerocarpa CS-585A2]ULP71543.1 L-Ala-D/L-Glu epimerase [Nodularia sphaerocarpa UHCC 0038]